MAGRPDISDRIPERPAQAHDYANEEDRAAIRERVQAVHEFHANHPTLSPKQKRYDLLEAMGCFQRMGLEHPANRAPVQPEVPDTPAPGPQADAN